MMEVIEAAALLPVGGVLQGAMVEVGVKRYADAQGWYLVPEALPAERLMYTVYSYTEGAPSRGNLNWGLTVLEAVLVGGECNMTRGHWHEDRACAEIYYGMRGTGLLMLMDETGRTWAERVHPGTVHHIDGRLAHRLINTGDEALAVAACWGCDAGHDYAAVEALPFGYRVFKDRAGALRCEPVRADEEAVR